MSMQQHAAPETKEITKSWSNPSLNFDGIAEVWVDNLEAWQEISAGKKQRRAKGSSKTMSTTVVVILRSEIMTACFVFRALLIVLPVASIDQDFLDKILPDEKKFIQHPISVFLSYENVVVGDQAPL
jgi:hypothetical protein